MSTLDSSKLFLSVIPKLLYMFSRVEQVSKDVEDSWSQAYYFQRKNL